MSMVLKRMSRAELIRQLEDEARTLGHERSKVLATRRSGETDAVVAVRENECGVFLYRYPVGAAEIMMARMFGSDMHEMTVEEVVERLEGCASEDVYLQWPSASPSVVVGKVFGVAHCGELKAYLVPVPVDIDEVNEEVRLICARRCDEARGGKQCGDCIHCGVCDILKDADDEIAARREGGEK